MNNINLKVDARREKKTLLSLKVCYLNIIYMGAIISIAT